MAFVIKPIPDGTHKNTYADANTCVRKYFVTATTEAEMLTHRPVVGRAFHWQASNHDWPGDEFKVRSCDVVAFSHPRGLSAWTWHVTGSTSQRAAVGSLDSLLSEVIRTVNDGTFVARAEMIGCRRATSADEKALKYNPDSQVCSQGEWIYNNAITGGPGSSSPDYCPIVNAGVTTTSILPKHLGRSFRLPVYVVNYYTRTPPSLAFAGLVLNWSSGSTPHTVPNQTNYAFGPPLRGVPLETGAWRCLNQNYGEAPNRWGTLIYRVTRSFALLPQEFHSTGYKWNPNIYGTWTAEWDQT